VQISIIGVKPNLTPVQVNTLMDTIIEKNVFFTASRALGTKVAATLLRRNNLKLSPKT